MTTPEALYDSMERLMALHEEQNRLMRELKRGYRLADLLGVPIRDMKGKIRTRFIDGRHRMFKPWIGAELWVQVDDNDPVKFKLTDVHHELWPEDVLAAYKRQQKRRKW